MDVENARTLSRELPHVLLALLKRMNSVERHKLLAAFEREFPKDFNAFQTADVKNYLKQLQSI